MLQAAAKALKEREAALLTLQAIAADLDKRRQSVAILEEEHQRVTDNPVSCVLCYAGPAHAALYPRLGCAMFSPRCAVLCCAILCCAPPGCWITCDCRCSPCLTCRHHLAKLSYAACSTATALFPCLHSLHHVLQMPGDKARGRKLENLKNEVASLEAAVQAASQEYGRVKQRNIQVSTDC